ncbi:MAG: septum formation initiator family protein [Deltaproteobacteria bacterium]|nr:MAG: septum formation initiator family protein [Deltaproteobacteria bacterium]
MAGAPAGEGTQKGGKNRRFLLGVLGFAALAVAFLALFSHQGLYKIYCLRQEREAMEQENLRLAAENASLARTIDRLQNDPEMIQDLIRRELNLVKKNEIILQFPPEGGKAAAPPGPALQAASPPPATGRGDKHGRPRSLPGPPPRNP